MGKRNIEMRRAPFLLGENNRSEVATLRASLYSHLGSVYLSVPDLRSLEKSMNQFLASTQSEGTRILLEFFRRCKEESLEEVQKDVSVEHSRLFSGIGQGYGPPPPYESVWMGEGRVMGGATVNVVKMYGEAGVELTAGVKEPPDHIGIELGYLSYLCNREAEAWKSTDTKGAAKCLGMEQEFLHKHIERWVPKFCEQIAANDRTGFYRGIAIMTKEFVLSEIDLIREELVALNQLRS